MGGVKRVWGQLCKQCRPRVSSGRGGAGGEGWGGVGCITGVREQQGGRQLGGLDTAQAQGALGGGGRLAVQASGALGGGGQQGRCSGSRARGWEGGQGNWEQRGAVQGRVG